MGNQLISNVFKALAHPTRIQIVKLLRNGELCVCDILPNLDSEQSNTSQHLAVLKNQGIVESRKDGSKVIYSLKNEEVCAMIDLAEAIILRQIEETKASLLK
ncbi:metalloregulator ArsR/SmtB family transcription factor [Desulfitobacterium sp.]|uniref:ArsR/SmtB family transcription factor n=1 Tax=Desulfitobacterium sp. TaxID=49981 RepID=UPI002B20B1A3|nr:metalloregulator ArsR/SmtB family transcription factor [Desulfitobacterium sp.]MEA4901787.1 metalloregulator ArsR/SmtB family transcription factor [Desulfitobacterium sp.]